MCTTTDEIGAAARPAGFFRSAWAWLRGRTDPGPTRRADPEPDIVMPDIEDAAAVARWLRQKDRQSGKPMCERCGSLRSEDDAIMHRRWCGSCDTEWVEESILSPLVARMGRRGARRALKALARGEIR
jgi:hypothetical protein